MATFSSSLPRHHLPASPSDGVRTLARFGFAAKGFVYCVVGGLAVMAATGMQGGRTATQRQALSTILDMPFGRVLLGLVAVGLAGFTIWRLVQAFRDTEGHGSGAKGMARRIGYFISALIHASFAYYAGRTALDGASSGQGGNTQQSLISTLLQQSYGQWLLGLIGLIVIGTGIYQIIRAYSGTFAKEINTSRLPTEQQRLVHRTGQLGYTARGIVWGIIGYFLIQAAMRSDAQAAQSTDGAFDFLATFGSGVLLVVALGLVAYGIYMLVRAKYPILRGV